MFIKALIKRYVFPAMSAVLARPIYAMANGLSRIPYRSVRASVLYDAMVSSLPTPLMYTNFGAEHFVVDTRDKGGMPRQIFAEGTYDFVDFARTLDFLKQHNIYSGPLTLLIDVGANIGPICIISVARHYTKRAIAIEPEPHNCRLLRANIALNGLTESISVHESACGMFDNETLELELSEDNLGDHRIGLSDLPERDNEDKRHRIQIRSNTLDTLCPVEPGENTLIWMDTQGYEGCVLAGARRWLDAGTPLVLEFDPYLMKRVNSFGLIKDALANYAGFHDLWHDSNNFHPIGDLDNLYEKHTKARQLGEIGFTNILAIGKTEVSFFR
jgi:FkbM family methyltransferase